jgi:hypothetical protein
MQNRKSNHIDNDNAHINNYFWQSIIGGTASLAGVFNGMHAGSNPLFPKPGLPYAFASALAAGVGLYCIKRVNSNYISNNEDLNSKSEAKSQATIAAIASGSSTLTGWMAMRHFGNKRIYTEWFTEPMLLRSLRMTVVGAGLVGFGLPILMNKEVQNRYHELEGVNLKEKVRFFLFKDRSKNINAAPTQNEEIKDTNSSVLRK